MDFDKKDELFKNKSAFIQIKNCGIRKNSYICNPNLKIKTRNCDVFNNRN